MSSLRKLPSFSWEKEYLVRGVSLGKEFSDPVKLVFQYDGLDTPENRKRVEEHSLAELLRAYESQDSTNILVIVPS